MNDIKSKDYAFYNKMLQKKNKQQTIFGTNCVINNTLDRLNFNRFLISRL